MKVNGLYPLIREELLRLGEGDFKELSKGTSLERISYDKFMANLEINNTL